jgi:hypothetical protein
MLDQRGHFAEFFAARFALERFIARVGLEMAHEFLSLAEHLAEVMVVVVVVAGVDMARTIVDSPRGCSAGVTTTVRMLCWFATVRPGEFRLRDAGAAFPETRIL